ncbi:hypothetical protein SAMN05660776_1711 [Salegentibacter holothuriorum]|uniref:50S ribosomal protein L27 n=1 Tax=Salegentibacter holothuriorum TaxID=241145 RepID=A0A1T5C1U3_9FLAO|nr:hypothetical protein [Salegentibacter holothuriorum]SKB53259.1 hypothetical protein SAMN05660776_1711 [Salegentibacter holothuriorum]
MYPTVQFIHSYWAYLVLIVLFVAVINSIIGYASNKEYGATNFRIALFTLITSHIQFLIGVVLYFTSPYFSVLLEKGMGTVMPDPTLRLYIMEHPLMMIIALVLITMGYSKHKNKLTSKPKFKTLAIFYTLGLLVMLSRIPWSAWF